MASPAWLQADFEELHGTLLSIAESRQVSSDHLEDLLSQHEGLLKQLLDQDPTSDASRKKIQSRTVTLSDDDYELNTQFVDAALQLADDLSLDEIRASELLLLGQEESASLDREPSQASIIIYHRRRHYIAECVRLILSLSLNEQLDTHLRKLLQHSASSLGGRGTNYAGKILSTMSAIREWISKLADKARLAAAHSFINSTDLMENLRMQANALSQQHQALGLCLCSLVQHEQCGMNELDAMVASLKLHKEYDFLVLHQIPAYLAIVAFVLSPSTNSTVAEIKRRQEDFVRSAKDDRWDLQYVHAAVHLVWFTEVNGLVRDAPANMVLNVDYQKDIHEPVKIALGEGALDFLMAVAADTNHPKENDASREDFRRFLQTKTPFKPSEITGIMPDFQAAITNHLEIFMDSFISNMADILKDIKNVEEEDQLINRESAYNLERFFLLIAFIFRNRDDAGMTFWSDRESNLYGFLTWASQRQTPLMAAAYCDMLASLATGQDSAQKADHFLTEDSTLNLKSRRPQQVSWDFIFQSLHYYINQLRPKPDTAPNHGFRAAQQPPEPLELDVDHVRVLDAYLRLITSVVKSSTAARDRILENPNARLIATLMELLDSTTHELLVASIFNTLTAFCKEKSEEDNIHLWDAIDRWATSVPPGIQAISTKTNGYFSFFREQVFRDNFAPADSYVKFMTSLIRPVDATVTDALPYPENLGSSNRLPGVDFYVDSVISLLTQCEYADKISGGNKWTESERLTLQTSCLEFIMTGLSSFDDQLIVVANTSQIAVDAVMQTSNLATYVKLHPFTRLMEHLFSEVVLSALFSILRRGVEQAVGTPEDPLVIESILMTIRIMTIILEKEHTYLEVIRPQLWKEESASRKSVANTALSSFETAVLYHLPVVVHLGLYGGMEHSILAIEALKLLSTLSASKVIATTPPSHFNRGSGKNRLLTIADSEGESRRIAFGFINQLERRIDKTDLPPGELHPDSIVKLEILSFLITCLSATPEKPTLAHLILGFAVNDDEVDISEEPSGIGSGNSVFHSILSIANTWEEADLIGNAFTGELMALKRASLMILRFLWQSKLTSSDTFYILRENKFFFAQFSQEVVISSSTYWQGVEFADPTFFYHEAGAAACFQAYLECRTCILDYLALELRQMSLLGASGSLKAYNGCLMGVTDVFGQRITHASILDYLDFLELDVEAGFPQPTLSYFRGLNYAAYLRSAVGGEVEKYNINHVRSMLNLRKAELRRSGRVGEEIENAMAGETDAVLNFLLQDNNSRQCRISKVLCLQQWCRLVVTALETAFPDLQSKSSFIIQALQTVIPKLEHYCGIDERTTLELTAVAQSLLANLDFDTINLGRDRGGDVAHDRLYQLFRLSLRGVQSPIVTTRIREDFYDILCRYLNGMAGLSTQLSLLNRRSLQTIRGSGERFLEILCNDAYIGAGNCKLLALNLLDALVALGQEEESTYIVDVLRRQNLITVLVQSLRNLDQEALQVTDGGATFMTLVKAITGFLLRLSRTKLGAGMIISSGYFAILRECGLFTVDPDIGISFMGGKNISSYYELLVSFVRVLVSCLLCKGLYNKSDLSQTQQFLADNRILVSSILKRHANIGNVFPSVGDMGPLVDLFVVLYSMADSVEA